MNAISKSNECVYYIPKRMCSFQSLTYFYFSGATATCGPWPDRESGSNVTCHLLHFDNLLFPAPEDLIRRHLSIAFLGDPLLFALLDNFGVTLRGLCFYPCVLKAPPTSTVGLSPLPLNLVRQNHVSIQNCTVVATFRLRASLQKWYVELYAQTLAATVHHFSSPSKIRIHRSKLDE